MTFYITSAITQEFRIRNVNYLVKFNFTEIQKGAVAIAGKKIR